MSLMCKHCHKKMVASTVHEISDYLCSDCTVKLDARIKKVLSISDKRGFLLLP